MINWNDERAVILAEMFRLMGDHTRLRIVLLICATGRVPVGNIATQLQISPSLVSHHLRLLRAARIVRTERQGRQIFYSPADAHIERVIDDMATHVTESEGHASDTDPADD
ncbi:MAG: metalloregulator ArsR/SmtB family transcription factor [Proteobacteria bacterium]|nr:metalloregulator ArsR/SmtB family transcription factor [Pseudomonadota bacterium]